MSAACNACGAMGTGCPSCEMTVKPGELPTGWKPLPVRPFHEAAAALVRAAQQQERTCETCKHEDRAPHEQPCASCVPLDEENRHPCGWEHKGGQQ